MKLVFDIEADNLLPQLTKFHCAGAIDVDTGQEWWFRSDQLTELLELLDKADIIIAHNAMGYDVPALNKLTGWQPKATVYCTKVMSQVLNYNRFGFGHSLKTWGKFFKDDKIEYTGGFEEFNEEMFEYMKQDVRLTVKVYKYLMNELRRYVSDNPKNNAVLTALRLEIEMDGIMSDQCETGWLFNVEKAKSLVNTIDNKMQEIADFINPKLGLKIGSPDGSVEKLKKSFKETGVMDTIPEKTPKYSKAGKLDAAAIRWFELDPNTNKETSPVLGPYTRIEINKADIGNTDTVKEYITSIGWVPDEWNFKRINGELKKVSAKLSDTSLEPLGEVGKALSEYYTLRSRKSILEGWFEYIDSENRLHGDVFNIGTPTFRQTHKIIANLPGANATLGKEFRELFIVPEGRVLVSADSAACQLRLLAHFMNDPVFTDTVLHGDVHQMNADIINCTRGQAKRFIFAFLYGAGPPKLSGYIDKTVEETKKAVKKYKESLPKLNALIEQCMSAVDRRGYIYGLDRRKVCLDSSERHKALNYLIQSSEAIIMKATVMMIRDKFKEANIDAKILLFYHDEVTYEVREDHAELAKEIIRKCFEDAPKAYGVNIMTCGDCKIGKDYYEVH